MSTLIRLSAVVALILPAATAAAPAADPDSTTPSTSPVRGLTSREVFRHDGWSLYAAPGYEAARLRAQGHVRPNLSRGQNFYNAHGARLGRSATTASGREFFFDNRGGLVGRSVPGVDGSRSVFDARSGFVGRTRERFFDRHDAAGSRRGLTSR